MSRASDVKNKSKQKKGLELHLGQRGAALLIASLGTLLLSTLSSSLLLQSDTHFTGMQAAIEKKRAFYVGEALIQTSLVLIEGQLSNTLNPQVNDILSLLSADLNQVVTTHYPTFRIRNYMVTPPQDDSLHVEFKPGVVEAPIKEGPFEGMLSPTSSIRIRFEVVSKDGNDTQGTRRVDFTMTYSIISPFQFLSFEDKDKVDTGSTLQYARGRAHSNQNACLGGAAGQFYSRVTAAKRVINNFTTQAANQGQCPNGGGPNISFATDDTFTNFATLLPHADNGCTDCDGSGFDWKDYALNRWNGRVQDEAHGVRVLKPPFSDQAKTQMGRSFYFGAGDQSNLNSFRYLIDPVLAIDTPDVKNQKLAFRADVRILDGVWYIKDPNNPQLWPGIPIWSDHPGNYVETGVPIGQDDIRTRWGWTTTPGLYSYYEYDPATQSLINNDNGAISYGTMTKLAGNYIPAFWLGNAADGSALCSDSNPLISCNDPATGAACSGVLSYRSTLTCTNASTLSPASLILNSTRSGFRNGFIQQNSSGSTATRIQRSKLLPLNFDVAQFQLALASTTPGELGSYFAGGASFNGIVYISNHWPGSLNGFSDETAPADWPFQSSEIGPLGTENPTNNDNAQAAMTTSIGSATLGAQQRALPFPLCSGNLNQPFDGPSGKFITPNCAAYKRDGNTGAPLTAMPSVVRILNGANLNKTVLVNGLTIATNMPSYLVGDYNTGSIDLANIPNPTPNWVPTLIATDSMHRISNAWLDQNAPWHLPFVYDGPLAESTIYVAARMDGAVQPEMENWNGKIRTEIGSGTSAFFPAYSRYGQNPSAYGAPASRVQIHDPQFEYIANQPPGTPFFGLTLLMRWQR